MRTLKAIIVSAPSVLREQLDRLSGKMTLLRHLAALRPGPLTSTTASAKISLRAIARRWPTLDAEVRDHDVHLELLTQQLAPDLVQAHGMSAGTAAEMLLLVGDNRERIHSEAALAKLCGVCPVPGLQRQDQPPPAQPRRRPTGQCRPLPCGYRAHARSPADP